MPVFSSGQSAKQAADTWRLLGSPDLIFACGGGIMAHPGGIAAGIRSVRSAWEAAIQGVSLAGSRCVRQGIAAGIGEIRRLNTALASRVISWYGDDFTGSTDALEALAPHMPSVLFPAPSGRPFLCQFADYAAFGLAGSSRSESPEWMDTHLSDAFAWLASLGTSVCHYKVCSTFDSSPQTGNIGRAAEIGKRIFGLRFVPIVVGAPDREGTRLSAICSPRSMGRHIESTGIPR